MTDRKKMTLAQIESLARDALTSAGTSAASAASLARAVAAAERDGLRSHGLVYVPVYCEHLRCGKVNRDAAPTRTHPAPGAIRVDADCGFAHPAIDLGFEALIPAAQKNGCAVMTIHNSYNCGVLGYHVERLAESGLLALGFTNAPASIAPVGGSTAVIGTNPFAVGVPDGRGGAALVIDQSASVVAKSEVMLRIREGNPLPAGWVLDSTGAPTTDPDAALKGTMAPSGGYKGFGVGLLVELMAAALSGAMLAKDASPFSGTDGGPPKTGQCFIALDPDGLSGGAFPSRVAALCEAIASQPGARLPADRRKTNRAQAEEAGVAVDAALLARIQQQPEKDPA